MNEENKMPTNDPIAERLKEAEKQKEIRLIVYKGFLEISEKLAVLADQLDPMIKSYMMVTFGHSEPPLPDNAIRWAYHKVTALMADARIGGTQVLKDESFNRILAGCPESIE